jgi:hypothetical protein
MVPEVAGKNRLNDPGERTAALRFIDGNGVAKIAHLYRPRLRQCAVRHGADYQILHRVDSIAKLLGKPLRGRPWPSVCQEARVESQMAFENIHGVIRRNDVRGFRGVLRRPLEPLESSQVDGAVIITRRLNELVSGRGFRQFRDRSAVGDMKIGNVQKVASPGGSIPGHRAPRGVHGGAPRGMLRGVDLVIFGERSSSRTHGLGHAQPEPQLADDDVAARRLAILDYAVFVAERVGVRFRLRRRRR